MDQDYTLDLAEVRRSLEAAEVISIYFPMVRKTLLLDTRSSPHDPPMVRVVPMTNTVEERFRELRRLRPRFTRPETLTVIPWMKYVGSLKRLGVWEAIVDRMVRAGGPAYGAKCDVCYQELLEEERAEVRRALTGENYESLWDQSEGEDED